MINIERYTGDNIIDRLVGTARELYVQVNNYVHVAFGDNVEYEVLLEQVLYCPQTRDYLYSAPEVPTYKEGSRPILEEAAKAAVKDCTTDREKVIALMVYIRDLKEKSLGYDYFYGGTEEDLIKKGERYCERVSRLMVCLCEILGIPSRMVHHVSGGHMTTEVYIEGKWAYIDPRFGLFYLNDEGKLMSVEELVENPDMLFKQPQWVYEYGSKEKTAEQMMNDNRDMYFSKREMQCYVNYSLADADKYHYDWMPSGAFPVEKRDSLYGEFAAARKAYFADTELYKDGVVVD